MPPREARQRHPAGADRPALRRPAAATSAWPASRPAPRPCCRSRSIPRNCWPASGVATRVTSQYTSDLDSAASIIMTVTAMIEAREVSPGHCYRMANYATALGRALRLSDADLQALYRGAFLHDIGMLVDSRRHPAQGRAARARGIRGRSSRIPSSATRCAPTSAPCTRCGRSSATTTSASTARATRTGCSGDEVPLLAQIVSIVDLFEAITWAGEYIEPRTPARCHPVLRARDAAAAGAGPTSSTRSAALVASGALEKFRGAAQRERRWSSAGWPPNCDTWPRRGSRRPAVRGALGARTSSPRARARRAATMPRASHPSVLVYRAGAGRGLPLVRGRRAGARGPCRPRAQPARRQRRSRRGRRPRERHTVRGGAVARAVRRARRRRATSATTEPLGLTGGFAIR